MNAGRLHHQLTIQAATETRDAHGQAVRTWAAVATVWGRVEPLRGRELFQAQQAEARVDTRITIRRYAGLTSHHRILFGTRTFELVTVPDAGIRTPSMELLAIEAP